MTILLVEDDNLILKGLKNGIPWNQIESIEKVETATDGELALERMETEPVDIVITDINMPFMDGLELTKAIHAKHPEIPVIILTGYSTFAYAKEALKLGVFDYLMKPVQSQELITCVKRAIDKLIETRMEQLQLHQSRPLLQQDFLRRLSGGSSFSDISSIIKNLGLEELAPPLATALVHIDLTEESLEDEGEAVFEVIGLLEKQIGGYIWLDGDREIGLIHSELRLQEKLVQIIQWAEKQHKISMVISLGPSCSHLEYISESMREARKLSDGYAVLFHNEIITRENLGTLHSSGDVSELKEKLVSYVCQGNKEACANLVESIEQFFPIEQKKSIAMSLLFQLGTIVTRLEDKQLIDKVQVSFDACISQMMATDKIPSQFSILKQAVETICESIHASERTDPINTKMLEFIRQHYTNPLFSLQMLSDHMGMSPTYLSALFKQKNSASFSEYVINLRMQKARLLLLATKQKTYDIAKSIGFTNPQYFSARFKQIYGMTPSEYKEGKADHSEME